LYLFYTLTSPTILYSHKPYYSILSQALLFYTLTSPIYVNGGIKLVVRIV